MYDFFEKNEIYDNVTSFLAELTQSGETANTYTYSNIAPLITYCMNETEEEKQDEDWNKVVLIPIKTEIDSNGTVTSIKSNLDMESTCLMGGENSPLKMQILFTTF